MKHKNKEFDYLHKKQTQYENSAKVVFMSMVGIGIIVIGMVVYTWLSK